MFYTWIDQGIEDYSTVRIRKMEKINEIQRSRYDQNKRIEGYRSVRNRKWGKLMKLRGPGMTNNWIEISNVYMD